MDKIIEALKVSVRNTFAEMLFLDVAEAAGESIEGYSHILRLTVMEPEYLDLVLWLPLEIKKEIAETIYSKDWDDITDTEIDDCLLEILNVLTGNFLIEYAGPDVKYSISLPEILFDEDELDKTGYTDIFFDAEDKLFKVSVAKKS